MKKIKAAIHANLPMIYMREGDTFIAYTPALDLCAHGDSLQDAKEAFKATVELFFEEVIKRNTLPKVLREYGWTEAKKQCWLPPVVIGQDSRPINISIPA